MSTLTIRNVEPAVKEQLRVRAARNGRSMEAELRAILAEAVGTERDREPNLAEAIQGLVHHMRTEQFAAHPDQPIVAIVEPDLAEAIRRRFQPFGGVDDLEPHPPVTVSEPPALDR